MHKNSKCIKNIDIDMHGCYNIGRYKSLPVIWKGVI